MPPCYQVAATQFSFLRNLQYSRKDRSKQATHPVHTYWFSTHYVQGKSIPCVKFEKEKEEQRPKGASSSIKRVRGVQKHRNYQDTEDVRMLHHVHKLRKPMVCSGTYTQWAWLERSVRGVMGRQKWDWSKGPREVRSRRTTLTGWDFSPKATKRHMCFQAFRILKQFLNVVVHQYHQQSSIFRCHLDTLRENFRPWGPEMSLRFLKVVLVIMMLSWCYTKYENDWLLGNLTQRLKIPYWRQRQEVLSKQKAAFTGCSQQVRYRKQKAGTMGHIKTNSPKGSIYNCHLIRGEKPNDSSLVDRDTKTSFFDFFFFLKSVQDAEAERTFSQLHIWNYRLILGI